MVEPKPTPNPNPVSGAEHYANLPSYSAIRHAELSKMLAPFVQLTDEYGSLTARITWALGERPPGSLQDRVVRDLLADTSNFLYEWRRCILEGKTIVAYPLARRSFESLSLMCTCMQEASLADRWAADKQIQNSEVRRALAGSQFSEDEAELKKLYAFFSKGAHPNRALVARTFLGEGNRFVLGSIAKPDQLFSVDHCLRLVSMWFWFGAAASFWFREAWLPVDPSLLDDYLNVASKAKQVTGWLSSIREQLLDDQNNDQTDPTPPTSP